MGIIGCGNMASAIVKGINQVYPDIKFLCFDPRLEASEKLASEVGGKAVETLAGLSEADSILIGCKPQHFSQLVEDLDGKFDLSSKHYISIMAAMPMETIKKALGADRVTRVMPNTPMMYNEGVCLLLNSDAVSEKEEQFLMKCFSSVSKVHLMKDEETFDQVTTVSGSGPAYVFQFAKTMADKLELWGTEPKEARDIVEQLFIGASKLMSKRHDITLDELIDQVTSKGGVTIEAVKVYRENNLTKISSDALDAAFKRSQELTNELGKL